MFTPSLRDTSMLASAITLQLVQALPADFDLDFEWKHDSGFVGFYSAVADIADCLERAFPVMPDLSGCWLYEVGAAAGRLFFVLFLPH